MEKQPTDARSAPREWLVWVVILATAGLLWLAAEAPDRRGLAPSPPTLPVTVYITDGGDSYHRAGCPFLGQCHKIAVRLSTVVRSHTPCKDCKPATHD